MTDTTTSSGGYPPNANYRLWHDRVDHEGLRHVSNRSCPRLLVRKRCKDEDCWCRTWLNDHGNRYQDKRTGQDVIVWEPYSAGGDQLAGILAAADDDGLCVTISGTSPWNPGRTVAIRFSADDSRARLFEASEMAPAAPPPWPHFPHCPGCHRRLWSKAGGVPGPIDGCCPHCGCSVRPR